MNTPFNIPLIETCPDFITRMRLNELKTELASSGTAMTPFQESAANVILSIIPKSLQEEEELIEVLVAITDLNRKEKNGFSSKWLYTQEAEKVFSELNSRLTNFHFKERPSSPVLKLPYSLILKILLFLLRY